MGKAICKFSKGTLTRKGGAEDAQPRHQETRGGTVAVSTTASKKPAQKSSLGKGKASRKKETVERFAHSSQKSDGGTPPHQNLPFHDGTPKGEMQPKTCIAERPRGGGAGRKNDCFSAKDVPYQKAPLSKESMIPRFTQRCMFEDVLKKLEVSAGRSAKAIFLQNQEVYSISTLVTARSRNGRRKAKLEANRGEEKKRRTAAEKNRIARSQEKKRA